VQSCSRAVFHSVLIELNFRSSVWMQMELADFVFTTTQQHILRNFFPSRKNPETAAAKFSILRQARIVSLFFFNYTIVNKVKYVFTAFRTLQPTDHYLTRQIFQQDLTHSV
jgi:hypothetical protein